jgi:hypothetical protein
MKKLISEKNMKIIIPKEVKTIKDPHTALILPISPLKKLNHIDPSKTRHIRGQELRIGNERTFQGEKDSHRE